MIDRFRAEVADDGTVTTVLNGQPGPTTDLSTLPQLITSTVDKRRRPLVVEIHDSDGSVVVDLINPAAAPNDPPSAADQQDDTVSLIGMHFTPGETVLVAVVVGTATATAAGTARADRTRESQDETLILLGRGSGRVTLGKPA